MGTCNIKTSFSTYVNITMVRGAQPVTSQHWNVPKV